MKIFKRLGIILLVLILVYFIGPQPSAPHFTNDLPSVPSNAAALEKYIYDGESKHKLKPDNNARICWFNDSLKDVTEYALVYLHGFSASQEEGDPVHVSLARRFGCNLYLARLAEHGIDTIDAMINLTAEKLWNSAKEAYTIGKQLGKKVILVGTSTGGTLALKLAAEFPEVAGIILLSPNIAINDPNAWILNNHWGLQIARMIKGKYNISSDTSALYKKYWYHQYRMEAVVQLEELLENSMKPSLFDKVKQPTLLLYYYKDKDHEDNVVKVSAMQNMFKQLGTGPGLKREVSIPNAGDHVIGSYIKSKDIKTVQDATAKFMEEIMHLPARN